jgi:hypothetical protein
MTPNEAAKRVGEIAEWFDRLHTEHPLDGRDADARALRVLLAERDQYKGILVEWGHANLPGSGWIWRLQQRAEAAEARLREVEEQLAQARRADEDRAYRAVLTRLREVEAERDALRKALLEVHGTEPSLNFTNGKPVDYCPLCDDGTWPCKVALLLDPTLKGGDRR